MHIAQPNKTSCFLKKDGKIIDLPSASDNLNISALAKPVEKYFYAIQILFKIKKPAFAGFK